MATRRRGPGRRRPRRRHTGHSFSEHLRELRLERAALLLRETGLGVRRIAAAVGWTSDGYLERRFKARFGTTPGRWRRGHRL